MKFKLLNFDHGYDHPESFSIGPFLVEITEQHCHNLALLPRHESTTFGLDKDYKPTIKETLKIQGGWIETAVVKIDIKDIRPSVIFPVKSEMKSIHDLCLLLSFISGRVVTLENNPFINHLNPEAYTDKAVHYGYFSRTNFLWNNLSALRNQGIAGQFYNLTMAYQSQDFVAKAVHYSNALNVAYDNWYVENPIKFIDKKLRSKIRSNIEELLKEHNIAEEIKNDVVNSVCKIGEPTATFKLKYFLRGIGLYPVHEAPDMHDRLKWLQYVRNSMAHTGMLPDRKLPDGLLGDATSGIIELVLRINQYYFGKILLGLNDPYMGFIKKEIKPYFYEGKFNDRLIFNETHKDFMERAKREYMSKGN